MISKWIGLSFQARSRLAAQFSGVDEYKWVEATVLAGLTEEEMRLLLTNHNLMAEAKNPSHLRIV